MPSQRHPRLWLMGQAVRAIREARGLTTDQLAQKARISHNHLSAMELHDRQPSRVVLVRLAQALTVPLDAIAVDLERLPEMLEKAPRGAA